MGTLGEAIAAKAMSRHHRHILQVAVAALLADRTVVRVVGHQPLHHAFTKLFGFTIIDRDKGAVCCRGHTGHNETTAGIFSILKLLNRTLAAGTNTAQRRVPAKIGNIKAQRETRL